MPSAPDHAARRRTIVTLLVCVFGFAVTFLMYDPGVMSRDARFIYTDAGKGFLGDWQSPVMVVLWRLIDPIAPGSRSMFLLIVILYWLSFSLIALKLARRSW